MGPPRGATCICPHYLDIKWLFFQYNGPSSKSHRSKGRPSLLPVTMTMGHWEIQEASNTQCTPTSSLSALGNTKSLERTRGPRKGVSTLSELDTHLLCSGPMGDWLLGFWKLLALPILPWRLALRNQYLCQTSGYRWKTLWFFFPFWFFRDRVSLCSLGYPGSLSVDQVGLELKNLPASAPQALGLKTCATTAQGPYDFLHNVQSYQQHHKQISGYHLCPPKLQETPLKKS